MFKKTYSFILILLAVSTYAQPQEGALKTTDGVLIYSNNNENTYTLHLKGKVDIGLYPIIRQDTLLFQFFTTTKSRFGKSPNIILDAYMKMESKYLDPKLKDKIKIKNEFFDYKNTKANVWYYSQPISKGEHKGKSKRTYYLDFIKNDMVYRFKYATLSKNTKVCINKLIALANSLRFYNTNVDIKQLMADIKKGSTKL